MGFVGFYDSDKAALIQLACTAAVFAVKREQKWVIARRSNEKPDLAQWFENRYLKSTPVFQQDSFVSSGYQACFNVNVGPSDTDEGKQRSYHDVRLARAKVLRGLMPSALMHMLATLRVPHYESVAASNLFDYFLWHVSGEGSLDNALGLFSVFDFRNPQEQIPRRIVRGLLFISKDVDAVREAREKFISNYRQWVASLSDVVDREKDLAQLS